MAKHEYARTCKRCQTTWYVPEEVAKAKPQNQALGTGWFTPMIGSKRTALRSEQAMIKMRNEQLASSQQCPQCGSSSYAEKRVSA